MAKAYEAGSILANAKGDFVAAAKVLDMALAAAGADDSIDKLKVLILRADLSIRLSEKAQFTELIKAAETLLRALPASSAMEERRLLAELKDVYAEG